MKSNYKKLGDYIRPINVINTDRSVTLLKGISSIYKNFMTSKANIVGVDFHDYKIVDKGQFAYNPNTARMGDKIPIALNEEEPCIVSKIYPVFEIIDNELLDPKYLLMWFKRPEFDRYARFKSHGSAREVFEWDQMCEVELPIPSIDIQKNIVHEYNITVDRITANTQMLLKMEEAAKAIFKQWFIDFEFPGDNSKPYKSSSGQLEFNEELATKIPVGWEVKSLLDLSSYINRGITPSYVNSGGIIVLNQRCIRDNTIDFSYIKRHNNISKKIDQERFLQQFDIVVNSTGVGTLGRVGLVKEKFTELIVDTHITVVRPSELTNPLYLWFNLSSRTNEIENLAEGSTGQTELGRSNLGKLRILTPPKKIQDKFAQIITPFVSFPYKIEQEMPILAALKETLLSKLATIES